VELQRLLFGTDDEAQTEAVERLAALEQKRAYAAARKAAWEEGTPFPEDHIKWCAAHSLLVSERSRAIYHERYPKIAEYTLRSVGRARAQRLGCKVGKRGPILKVYRRAVHAPVLLCYWCKRLTFPGERHVDHIEPLAAGGEHVSGNLCVTCVECNLSKGDKDPRSFREMVADKRAANSVIAAEYFRQRAAERPSVSARVFSDS
jgi:5-methylcytosine-specific restriction endonuclease McrA